jgi:two-component system, chemotaxis family, protein-glutamate methylesterase/glutaminase
VIRVLVVDDSAVMRRLLATELAGAPDIEIVGTAVDAYDAREKILRLEPDVVTLDIEMPRMNGLSFLERLMKYRPLPVVIVSSVAPQYGATAVRALELGAVEIIAKPGSPAELERLAGELTRAVRAAAIARLTPLTGEPAGPEQPLGTVSPMRPAERAGLTPAQRQATGRPTSRPSAARPSADAGATRVIAVGASTGGPVALERLLALLPATAPGVLIVQHIPAGFTAALARRLDDRCAITVREADDGAVVRAGEALIAPGGRHMVLLRHGARLQVRLRDGPPVHFQRPSVDVLFHSVAQAAGAHAVGVLLTGMGSDGASGMRELRTAGAHTIAQDEQSCAVFSMPQEAIRLEGVCEVLPLPRIAAAALRACARATDRAAHAGAPTGAPTGSPGAAPAAAPGAAPAAPVSEVRGVR